MSLICSAKMDMRTITTRFPALALLLASGILLFPCVALAAEEENKWGPLLTVGRFFNLALVIGVLVWVARRPLATFFLDRTRMIREQLAEAQAARLEADAKMAKMSARMSRLDEELREIKAQAERESQDEYERLVSAAHRDADKIVERARQEIEGMIKAGQMELRAHAAELSVKLAEEKIRREITDEDRRRLFSGFVARLGVDR